MPVQTNVYLGVDSPGVAALLHSNGFFYRMVIYRVNRGGPGNNYANELRATCYVEQDQNQEVLLFESVVRSYEDVGFSAEIYFPKIIASGDFFVVHWVEGAGGSGGGDLHRATINPLPQSASASWTYQGTSNIHLSGLYDVCPITTQSDTESTTDYIVAKKVLDSQVTVVRYNGLTWVDTEWFENLVGTTIGDHCLGVAADLTVGTVIAAWERGGGFANQLWSATWDVDTGGIADFTRTFNSGLSATGLYTSVGICVDGNGWFILADARPVAFDTDFADRHVRYVAWVITDDEGVVICPEQAIYNVNLVSRPWQTHGTQIFAAVSFKNVHGSDTDVTGATLWDQAYLLVLNFDALSTRIAAAVDTVRPFLSGNFVSQATGAVFDARPAGQGMFEGSQVGTLVKPINLLSPVTRTNLVGPDRFVYVFTGIEFGQVVVASNTTDEGLGPLGVAPINATVTTYRWHSQEPWAPAIDPSDPDDSDFHGIYARTSYDSAPSGDGLAIAGGSPSMYDGTQIVEINYPWYPEIVRAADWTTGDAGLGLDAGTYEYSCVYFWKDAQGQVHLSTMAVPNQWTIEGVEHAQVTYGPLSVDPGSLPDGGVLIVTFPGVGDNGADVVARYTIEPGDTFSLMATGIGARITTLIGSTLAGIVDSVNVDGPSVQITFEEGYALTEVVPSSATAITFVATASDPVDVDDGQYDLNLFTPNGVVTVSYTAVGAESLLTVLTELRDAAIFEPQLAQFFDTPPQYSGVTGAGTLLDPVTFTLIWRAGTPLISGAIVPPSTDVGTGLTASYDPSIVITEVSYGLIDFVSWNEPLRSSEPVYDPAGNGTALEIRTVNCSLKDNSIHYPLRAPINIIVYRRTVGDIEWRRCGSSAIGSNPIDYSVNDPLNWVIEFFDSFRDITGNEAFPLAIGGDSPELEAECPPPGSVMEVWQDRLWLSTGVDRRIYYTKESQVLFGENFSAPQFNFANNFRVDSIESEITAMVAMDQALVLFTESSIYVLEGTPNDNLGQGADLSLSIVASGTGCINPRSTVLGPPGIFFQSPKGYMLLSRGYEVDYVSSGAAVEDLIREGGNVRGAVLLQDRHQIKLCLGTTLLTYDYYQKMWSQRVLANSEEMFGMGVWRAYPNGDMATVMGRSRRIWLEQPSGVYWDQNRAGSLIPFAGTIEPVLADVTLDWVRMDGVAGCKRVYEIGVQLEKPNVSTVRVDIDYEIEGTYDDSASESFEFGTSVSALGSIQCIAQNLLLDNQTFTLTDGLGRTTVFYLNVSGAVDLLPTGETDEQRIVDLTGAVSASDVANAVESIIEDSWLAITVLSSSAGGLVSLRQQNPGTYNTVISDTVANAGWISTSFTGGTVTTANAYLSVPNTVQKMTAFRLRIYETFVPSPASGNTGLGENLKIQSVTIIYGRKPGLRQVPDSFKGTAS